MPYKFKELVDLEQLKELLESYSCLTGVPFAVVDYPTKEALLKINMSDMCTLFHFQNTKSIEKCEECKSYLIDSSQKEKQINIK